MPTLKDNNAMVTREQQAKTSSVMYKTTFSSQAKDVRHGPRITKLAPELPRENKENLPKNIEVQKKPASRRPRVGGGKKPIDMMIAGFRRCFRDAEDGYDDEEVSDDSPDQMDSLCAEIAALKTAADAEGATPIGVDSSNGRETPPLSLKHPAIGPSRSPPRWDAPPVIPPAACSRQSPPTAGGRQSSCPPPLRPRGRESPPPSARSPSADEVAGRVSPNLQMIATRIVERISPSKQHLVPLASRTVRRIQTQALDNSVVLPSVEGAPKRAQSAPPAVDRSAEAQSGLSAHTKGLLAERKPDRVLNPAQPAAKHSPTPTYMPMPEPRPVGRRDLSPEERFPPPSSPGPQDIIPASRILPTPASGDSPISAPQDDANDSRKRKGSIGVDQQPRRARRMSESFPSPPRVRGSSPLLEDDGGDFVIKVPRSPSPCMNPEISTCPSPPLVGPYSPPAPRQRRSSLSTPPSPIPPMCLPQRPAVPVENPLVPENDRQRLDCHEEWLQTQLALFSSCAPQRGGSPDPDADSENSDDDSEPDGPPMTVPGGGAVAPQVTSKYFAEFYARFEECKRLQHLPTLNLCFTLMDALLLLGHRKTLRVLLRKSNLPKLLASMQYNPKLNGLLHSRPSYIETMGKRLVAVPLPARISDLAIALYQLQFLKDTLIPVVCDETRYMNLNLQIMRVKAKLCQAVFDDRKVLPQLFTELRSGSLSPNSRLDHLRFLKEFLELAITSYPGDSASFWRGMLREYQLLTLLTTLLADDHHPVCRTAIDICLLLCDEESRKVLYGIIPQQPLFMIRLFDVFCNLSAPEATVLQLQATLPMLAASPHSETLPIFYDAAQQVLTTWLRGFNAHGHLPPPSHVNAFMELLSLAIHHHHRTFHYSHEGCVTALIDFCAVLWNEAPGMPHSAFVAANKGILSILHVSNEAFHHYLAQREVFRGMLRIFADGNNLITSSMLTLLHTILQLEIQPLIKHVCGIWFGNSTAMPRYRSLSFVQQLFLERHKTNPTATLLVSA